jgi:prepilin-type N-terminal cleavage/methylation domain-containing protein
MSVNMKKKKGLTLIELIIVLAITPIVLGLIYNVVLGSFKMINLETKKANVHEQAKTYISTLTHNLKNSRIYLDSTEISATTLSSIIPAGAKPVVYIEGYDNKRYMYVLEPVSGGKFDLKLYNFQRGVEQNKYIPKVDVLGNYDEEFVDPDVFAKLDADTNNKIIVSADNLDVSLSPGYSARFIYYDNFEYKSYLIADRGVDQYKIELDKVVTYNTTLSSKTTLMNFVEDARVLSNAENDKLCSVTVKAIDDGKVKQISTNVYVFVQS